MIYSCVCLYGLSKQAMSQRSNPNTAKIAMFVDGVLGLATVLFALISAQMGINLSSEVFYLTIGIGAVYAFANLTNCALRQKHHKLGTSPRQGLIWLAIGVSVLTLGILGLKIGFFSSNLSYLMMGMGTASLFHGILHRIVFKAGNVVQDRLLRSWGLET